MDANTRKRSQTGSASGLGTPLLFCTPAQASALLRESRQPVFLVRHGLTAWNQQMRLQGREDVPLNSEGRRQALHCAAVFKNALPQENLTLRCVYTSPLSRAYDTAAYISDSLSLGAPKVAEGLIERDYGSLSGLTPQRRRALYPTQQDYPKDVESVPRAVVRMKRTLAELCEMEQGAAVIAITHGGVMNALFSCLTRGRAGIGANITQNCTIAMIAVGRHDVIPLCFNLTSTVFSEYVQEIRFPELV